MSLARQPGTPETAGFDATRLQVAYDLMALWVDHGRIGGGVVAISRHGTVLPTQAFGRRCWQGCEREMATNDVFLVASVAKPLTAAMLMYMIGRGSAGLMDRVTDHLPPFAGAGREHIRLIHLLTHTSGLPDMLTNNDALRTEHAPLSAFVDGTCRADLLFEAGTRVSYQSMGTLLAGEISSRLAGIPLPQLMQQQLTGPAALTSTILGYRKDLDDRVVAVELPTSSGLKDTDWHWNSPYWRHLGAPWGGLHADADDLLRWLHLFLAQGKQDNLQILSAAVCAAMITDHTRRIRQLAGDDRLQGLRNWRWGLGWQLGNWGDFASPKAFSHSGATGTLVGADPDSGLACVILTTRPGAPLGRLVNAIQAAVLS